MANFDGTDDFFDSREVIERIEELTAEFIDATDSDPADIMSLDDWRVGLTDDDANELFALLEFRDDAECVSDWHHGETFIRDGKPFTDYVEELLVDCGYIQADFPVWIEIDWESTAANVQVDYTDFEFRGVTYWARA